MPNKPGKPKSKRTPVRLRHKIEKASAAKQRKQKKLAKKNPEWRSRLKKDPGIPNLFPYKDKLLHEIEEKKRKREEEYAKKREEANSKKTEVEVAQRQVDVEDEGADGDELSDLIDEEDMEEAEDANDSNPMSALLASARARATDFATRVNGDDAENIDAMDEDSSAEDLAPALNMGQTPRYTLDTSRRAFDKIFKSVLEPSDIVLYVLDARDPNGTRSKEVEHEIAKVAGGSKGLFLVLNKIDLVPPDILHSWLLYLGRYFPTIPLRASTPAPNAKIFDHKALTLKATSEKLLRTLKWYAHSKKLNRSMTVGVVGYPNVGKSSVINTLASRLGSRNSSCPVGAEAGVTTSLREVKLDGKLKLLDSPGIVFPSADGSSGTKNSTEDQIPQLSSKQLQEAHLTLLSALPPSMISDPLPAITLLLHRLTKLDSDNLYSLLLDQYGLSPLTLVPSGSDGDVTTDFLIQVARKRGRLGKGGVPNLQSAAMGVLMDWRDGRIRGWTKAPKVGEGDPQNDVAADQKEIVSQWAQEFKIEGLWGKGHVDDNGNEKMQQ